MLLNIYFLLLNLSRQSLNIISFVINIGLWAVKYLDVLIKEKSIILNLLIFIRKSKNVFIGKKWSSVTKNRFSLIWSNNSGIRLKDINGEHEVHPLSKVIFNKLLIALFDLSFENIFDALITFNQAILGTQYSVNNLSNCKVLVNEHVEET